MRDRMMTCLYWCLRGLGYVLFAACAFAWITAASCCVFLLIRLISYLFVHLLENTAAVIIYALLGYGSLLVGRYAVKKSLRFQRD